MSIMTEAEAKAILAKVIKLSTADECTAQLTGSIEGTGTFAFPNKPIPRKLRGLSRFVVTRGGEYCFMPGLTGLRWLAALEN